MNRKSCVLGVALVCVGAFTASLTAQEASLDKLVAKAASAMARLEFTLDNPMISPQTSQGQAVCIDAGKGIFVTLDIPANVPPDEMKLFRLIAPGVGGKGHEAALLGTDQLTGVSFVQIAGAHKWTALKFESKTDLKLGQGVFSVGLMSAAFGSPPYVGTAIVAAAPIRAPARLVHVTGGNLTNASSPVLSADGKAVGIVGLQLPETYRTTVQRQPADMRMVSREHTLYFTPAEELAAALENPPTAAGGGRKLSWAGVLDFFRVLDEEDQVLKLDGRPAVKVGQVVPGGPADGAGVKQNDIITELNGKPLEDPGSPQLVAEAFALSVVSSPPGSTITLGTFRDGSVTAKKLMLAPMPMLDFQAPRYYDRTLGYAGRDLVLRDRYQEGASTRENGVLVTVVRRDSPAAIGQMLPGDIITSADGKSVASVADLAAAAAKADATQPLRLVIQRGANPLPLVIKRTVEPSN